MINRFSLANNLERNKNKNNTEMLDSTAKLPIIGQSNPDKAREFISEDVVKPLLNFGYTLDQIMITHKLYKFQTVDDAIHLMMRDPETGKFHHRFLNANGVRNSEGYSDLRVPEDKCVLCLEPANEHIDYELKQINANDIKLEVGDDRRRGETNQKGSSNELTHTVLKTEDASQIVNTTNNNSDKKPESNREKKMLNLQQVEIPKETLEMFEDPEVCRICFAEVLGEQNKAQFACGHKFCKTCVTSHLNMNISNGKVS